MFRDLITRPIDPIPQGYADSLTRLENEPDYSLTSLGIAMLKPRIENYKGIAGIYYSYSTLSTCLSDATSRFDHLNRECPNLLYYKYNQDDNVESAKNTLTELGFTIIEKLSLLIEQKSKVQSVIAFKQNENCAVVFIKSSDIRFYHMIISFISVLFPLLFKDQPLRKPDEFDLIKTLSMTSKDAFVLKLKELIKPMAIEFRKATLLNILTSMHARKIRVAQDEWNNARERVVSRERELQNAEVEAHRLLVQLEGMKATEEFDTAEQELVDVVATDERIHDLTVEGTSIIFNVASTIVDYSADAWKTFGGANNRGSILDGQYGPTLLEVFRERDNRYKLLNSIFCESPIFAVKVGGRFKINFESNSVDAFRGRSFNDDDDPVFKNCLVNPHLYNFACMGETRKRNIRDALRTRNYVGALAMTCASAENLNLDEVSQNFRPFLGWILSSTKKIIRKIDDGTDMTPEEALIYLIDKEKEDK